MQYSTTLYFINISCLDQNKKREKIKNVRTKISIKTTRMNTQIHKYVISQQPSEKSLAQTKTARKTKQNKQTNKNQRRAHGQVIYTNLRHTD